MAVPLERNVTAQELVDMLPTGVVVLNHRDEPVFTNQRFRELTTCRSVKSFECWSKSIHPEDYSSVADAYFEALRSKSALRIEYRTRGQTSLWRALVLAPLEVADIQRLGLGNKGGFICTMTDITLEKTAELLQRRIADEAQERKRQQERFIDMISHEVRNPLSAILHCTEDILEVAQANNSGGPAFADIVEAAETISLCVAHQKTIVDDVLLFSKLDASMVTLSPRSVQPKRKFGDTLSIFRPELRKQDIRFEYRLDHSYTENGIYWVMADADRMSQVLINLVSNSIKFTAKRDDLKEIRVSMGASFRRPSSYPPNVVFFDSSESAIRLDNTTSPEWGNGETAYIMVAVRDTGIGISDHGQRMLFERFNQATPRTQGLYGGSGLGLHVSRQLCHLHGGEIGVSAKEGEGSTFGFFFKVRQPIKSHVESYATCDDLGIEKLCAGIQDLSQATTGSHASSPPDIPVSPPIIHAQEVAPGAPSDNRYRHTFQIASSARQADELAREEHKDKNLALNDASSMFPQLDKRDGHGDISSPSSHKILLVEDNVINRQIISRKLKAMGFQVSEATDGYEALDFATREHFDCILMDQEMPRMDGVSATKAIRKIEESGKVRVPILGVTANIRSAQQAEMMDAGMDDIIHKPYRTNVLLEKINQLLTLAIERRMVDIP